MKTEILSNGTIKLTVEAQSHFDKLVESKELGGLTRTQAESAAWQQIARDLGIVLNPEPALDYDEKVATAGVNANARQIATRGTTAETVPVEVHLHEGKFTRKSGRKASAPVEPAVVEKTVSKPAKA